MRELLKNFRKDFSDIFHNTLNYQQIRGRVIITKDYNNKGLILHYYRFVAILFLIALLGGVFLMLATNKVIYREQQEQVINFYNIEELTEWADYVFIAKVDKKLYTKQYDGKGYHMPYSYYSLTDINFLKGEGKTWDKLLFYGGYDFLNNLVVFVDNPKLPETGEYYIFAVMRTKPLKNSTRAESDSYGVFSGGQMRLLSGYIPTKGFNEQTSANKQLIKKFMDALVNNN